VQGEERQRHGLRTAPAAGHRQYSDALGRATHKHIRVAPQAPVARPAPPLGLLLSFTAAAAAAAVAPAAVAVASAVPIAAVTRWLQARQRAGARRADRRRAAYLRRSFRAAQHEQVQVPRPAAAPERRDVAAQQLPLRQHAAREAARRVHSAARAAGAPGQAVHLDEEFDLKGQRRGRAAEEGLQQAERHVDRRQPGHG
jgi:hypothetical protein